MLSKNRTEHFAFLIQFLSTYPTSDRTILSWGGALKAGPPYPGFWAWGQTPEIQYAMKKFYRYIQDNYQVIALSDREKWVVLEHKSLLTPERSLVIRQAAEKKGLLAKHDGTLVVFDKWPITTRSSAPLSLACEYCTYTLF